MSRKARIHYPGAFYHVLNRGNRREQIFWDEADYREMLICFAEAHQHYQLLVHAFSLMSNHFHLLAEVTERPLASSMKSAEGRYARYYNQRYRKVGHVFQGRYRAMLCDKRSYLLELVRYIHLNPVRAGLVADPADWPWSSHRAYLGLDPGPPWLYRNDVLSQFSQAGSAGLVEFLSQAHDLIPHPEYYQPEDFPLLGGRDWQSPLSSAHEPRRQVNFGYPGRRLSLELIAKGVARWSNIEESDLCGQSKEPRLVEVRDMLVYAAMIFFSYPNQKLASFLHRTASAISYSYQRAAVVARSQPNRIHSLRDQLLRL